MGAQRRNGGCLRLAGACDGSRRRPPRLQGVSVGSLWACSLNVSLLLSGRRKSMETEALLGCSCYSLRVPRLSNPSAAGLIKAEVRGTPKWLDNAALLPQCFTEFEGELPRRRGDARLWCNDMAEALDTLGQAC